MAVQNRQLSEVFPRYCKPDKAEDYGSIALHCGLIYVFSYKGVDRNMTAIKSKSIFMGASDVVERFTAVATAAGFIIYAVVDHERDMAARGVDAAPTAYTVIFGNPVAGAKVLKESMEAVVDLPLRIGIYERRKKEESVVIWRSMHALFESHDEKELSLIGNGMDKMMDNLISHLSDEKQ